MDEHPLISEFADDPEMAELIALFLDELAATVRNIQQAVIDTQLDVAAYLAHQLKGAAGGYGFPTITDAARDVETHARSGQDMHALHQSIEALSRLCRRSAA